jgi:ABC-type spermidine/putrescine transport system permease subunit II
MEILSQINTIQLCILIGIGFLLLLQQVGMKKGYFVKVGYSKPKRLFWAILISLIIASNSVVSGTLYPILLAIFIGFYLYFYKQYFELKRKKS